MDTVKVNMADESVNTTNSQPYSVFSEYMPPNQVVICGKTFGTREVVIGVLLGIAIVVIIALIPLASGVHITKVDPDLCLSEKCTELASYVITGMNKSVDKCENFHEYACGTWRQFHPLNPEESSRTVRGEMWKRNREFLRNILEGPVDRDNEWSSDRKMKDFFRSCLDEVHRTQNGGKVFLDRVVNKTGGWTVLTSFSEQQWNLNDNIQKVHVDFWTDVIFSLKIGTDWFDSKKKVIELDLGGLGLPWQQYTRTDEASKQTQTAYKKYIRQIGEMLAKDAGLDPNSDTISGRLDAYVNDVWEMEFGLANLTLYTLPTTNPHDDDMRLTLDELNEQAGGDIIDWKALIMYAFRDANVDANTKVVLLERDYIFKLGQFLKDIDRNQYLDDMKRVLNNYFTWRMVETYIPGLSEPYYKAQQEFRHVWTGAEAHTEVWTTCFNWITQHLPEGLGALFVRQGFPQEDKDYVHDMSEKIKENMKTRVDALTWMDDLTKERAKAKLDLVQDKLGYPDNYLDHDYIDRIHEPLKIDRNDLFGNLLSVSTFTRIEYSRQLVATEDKQLWRVNTWEVHAEYYNPWNELLVPAGFMQWPVYWREAPASYFNWGGLGEALSKQIILGLDETGGYYTPNGTVEDWWTRDTTDNFLESRQCVIDYYNTLEAGPYRSKSSNRDGETVKIRGSYYSRDAVTDIGGVRNAYKVWKDHMTANPNTLRLPGLDLNPDQLFFVSYAQNHCFNRRDSISYELAQDGFVPEDVRVNAALQQLEDFANVFECPSGSKMNPTDRCDVF